MCVQLDREVCSKVKGQESKAGRNQEKFKFEEQCFEPVPPLTVL